MKLAVEVVLVIFMTSCCIQLATCVPIEPKEEKEAAKDPCDLEELENIPKCKIDDKDCAEKSEKKREKRQTLCETNPTCGYCGALIPDDETDEAAVDPEIVEPKEFPSNATDSSDDYEEIEIEAEDSKLPPRRLVERNIIIENDNETQYYRGYVESAANITTVIRLTNLINNTNIINMPTTLNNTNINNIHIYQNKSSEEGGKFGLGYSDKGSCCYAVEPKNCKQSTSGLKCRHKRHKVCGRQCTNKIIHSKKNPCVYTPQWPFVSCTQNGGFNPPSNPGYYPPNYPSNYPPNYPPNYPGNYPPNYQPNYPGNYPQNPPDEFYDDDDDLQPFPDDDELNNPESGWIVSPEKCKVVSEDGLQILNCTQKGFEFEHPFARNTVSEPIKRNTRQLNYGNQPMPYQNQMMQQPMFYPVMYQPVYVQPMPMYYPQYYQQPPPMMNYPGNYYSQPQQIPLPPVDESDSFDDAQESYEDSLQNYKRHAKKHQPIIMDIDEEL